MNEASDVGSEWLLRASEGNQEILSDVGETQLSETANQIGRRRMCLILSAKHYLDDPLLDPGPDQSFALLRNGVKSFCSHFAEYHLTIILDLDLKLELQNQSLK